MQLSADLKSYSYSFLFNNFMAQHSRGGLGRETVGKCLGEKRLSFWLF